MPLKVVYCVILFFCFCFPLKWLKNPSLFETDHWVFMDLYVTSVVCLLRLLIYCRCSSSLFRSKKTDSVLHRNYWSFLWDHIFTNIEQKYMILWAEILDITTGWKKNMRQLDTDLTRFRCLAYVFTELHMNIYSRTYLCYIFKKKE